MIYDPEAKPGPLHMFYTYKDGLVFELDNAKIQLDTQNGGQLRVVVKMGNDEIRMEDNKVIIESGNIELGSGAKTLEKVILGDTFLGFFNQHTHATPAGPSSPPVSPMTTAQLSFITKTK
jgi:phage baseplate assembly protein gpV